jgi:CHAT domain-containing protein/tetratricopeptide (TPR) repeat protein
MALIEELAPEGPDAAAIREHLARHTPDPRRRAEHARRALAIRGGAAGTRRIDALHALAAAQIDLGDLDGAEQSLLRAGADIVGAEDRRADHDETRGLLSLARGDLAAAESMIGRALRREERRATVGVRSARLLVRLGDIARLQGDLDAAEAFLSRSLAFGEHENDDALAAAALAGLGDVAHERGDGARAEERHRKAGAILAAIDPDHPALARAWRGLAQVLLVAGRLDETEPIGRRVLAADERERPGTLALVETRHLLGELALRRGDPAAAERVGREALTLVQALAPGSRWEARTEELLAAAATRQGRREAAVAHLRRALDALEAQAARLGGSLEALAQFSARHEAPYRELEALLLALGRPEEAFHTLERRRSRALLALRRVRHLRIERFSPEEVRTEVRLADAAYDRVLRRLGDAPAADRAARDALAGELATARRRRQQARARRRWNGVVVTSEARAPLDLPGVRELLPAGTLLLAYSFGPQASRVYTVGPGAADFGVFPLTADDAELRDLVRGFREQVDARRGSQLQAAVLEHARRLGEVLLGPVAPVLRRSDALLVVPDGPLHLVPFAALVAPGSARYLVEEKPLHVVASATLYADLAALPPRPPGPIRVVGFGDPSYAASAGELPPPVTTAVRAGLRLDPLPFSRRELTGLQGLGGEPQIWLGADASEERAKALGADARIIHFACHGYVDREYPLESALALATPREAGEDAENGLLQAWEILEEVRIDAELVTLSACETAVGKAVPGEGVLGLTWAFQYAGARSVLASLWEVNDASTAELMGRFYAHLRTGHGKAEALRRAQLHLLQEPATSAPYFWAAFQLAGSGR